MSWYSESKTYLTEVVIPHRNYVKLMREANSRISFSVPGEMIFIVGPTRVGKSYLAQKLMEALYGTISADQEYFPYVIVTAANASTAGEFATRGFTRDALEETQHPIYCDAEVGEDILKCYQSNNRKTEHQMRRDLVKALKKRKVKVLVCDEMQNSQFVRGGNAKAAWFLDSLKCAAKMAGVILVIIGTYELLPIRDLCPQVIGRSDLLHLPRYTDTQIDKDSWNQVLQKYSENIPFLGGESLMDWSDFLREGSLGCFGLLNKWLRTAISEAHLEKSPCLKVEHLSRTLRTNKERAVVQRSIEFGEGYVLNPDYSSYEEFMETYQSTPESAPKKKSGRPYQRKARRLTGKERLGGTA